MFTDKNFIASSNLDLAEGAVGVLRLPVFAGRKPNLTLLRYEYYRIEIVNSYYTDDNFLWHYFVCKVTENLSGGRLKKVGDTFKKRGKNLYPNFMQEGGSYDWAINAKHLQRQELGLTTIREA